MIGHFRNRNSRHAVGGRARLAAAGVVLSLPLCAVCLSSQPESVLPDAARGRALIKPVVADAGQDLKYPILTDGAVTRPVVLDGSFSYSNLALGLTYRWLKGGKQIATGPIAHVVLGLGYHDIVLEVTDSAGNTDSDAVRFKIYEPTGPTSGEWAVESQGHLVVAYAGPDVELALDSGASTRTVRLDGSDSFSRLGLVLRYSWRYGGAEVGVSSQATVGLAPGTHTVVLKVTDSKGNVAGDTVKVKIAQAPGSVPVGCGATGIPLLAWCLLALVATKPGSRRDLLRPRRTEGLP